MLFHLIGFCIHVGYYEEGNFGIRIENLLVVVNKTDFTEYRGRGFLGYSLYFRCDCILYVHYSLSPYTSCLNLSRVWEINSYSYTKEAYWEVTIDGCRSGMGKQLSSRSDGESDAACENKRGKIMVDREHNTAIIHILICTTMLNKNYVMFK